MRKTTALALTGALTFGAPAAAITTQTVTAHAATVRNTIAFDREGVTITATNPTQLVGRYVKVWGIHPDDTQTRLAVIKITADMLTATGARVHYDFDCGAYQVDVSRYADKPDGFEGWGKKGTIVCAPPPEDRAVVTYVPMQADWYTYTSAVCQYDTQTPKRTGQQVLNREIARWDDDLILNRVERIDIWPLLNRADNCMKEAWRINTRVPVPHKASAAPTRAEILAAGNKAFGVNAGLHTLTAYASTQGTAVTLWQLDPSGDARLPQKFIGATFTGTAAGMLKPVR